MSRETGLRLDDIIQYAGDTLLWTAAETQASFTANSLLFRAVLYNLQVIGEAVKDLPDEVKQMDTDVPWRAIAGLRDVVAHAYFRLDASIVWEVATEQLPGLLTRVTAIRSRLSD